MPDIFNQDRINLTQNEQINKLNSEVKCRLGVSKIDGIGVFAMFDIKKGERLYCFPGAINRRFYTIPRGSLSKLWPEVKELILQRWPSIINGSAFLSPNDEIWLCSFINHDSNPNYEQKTDMALRDIKAGEEITESYREMINAEEIYPWLK